MEPLCAERMGQAESGVRAKRKGQSAKGKGQSAKGKERRGKGKEYSLWHLALSTLPLCSSMIE